MLKELGIIVDNSNMSVEVLGPNLRDPGPTTLGPSSSVENPGSGIKDYTGVWEDSGPTTLVLDPGVENPGSSFGDYTPTWEDLG